MSACRLAIDQTTSPIDRRAKYYLNLIVAVVVVNLGSLGWAVLAWAWRPLYNAIVMDGDDEYIEGIVDYVQLNPAHAGLAGVKDGLEQLATGAPMDNS